MKTKGVALTALLLGVFASCSSAPPTGPEAAKALIEQSATAMGGWNNIDSIKSQEILTGGDDWEPMQSLEPTGDFRNIDHFGQTILIDLTNNRIRVTHDGLRSYPQPGPVKFAEVIDGSVAMLQTTTDGKVTSERLHPSRMASRIRDMNRLPIRVLKVAKAAPDLTRAADVTVDKKTFHVLKYKDSGLPVELHLDSFNNLPASVVYMEDDPIYGDTANEVVYSDWKDRDGVRLPDTIVTLLNGNKIREEHVRTLLNNSKHDEAAFAIPDDIRAQPEVGEPIVSQWTLRRAVMGVGYQDFGREQKVTLDQIGRGVYHVTGSSHNSLAVEMKDHIVVIEMPLFEERSLAVMKALEDKIPGKPVKFAVMTHYHIDHSGGVRAYAAKGATIYAPESIVPFVNETLSRPHTIRPDSLAKGDATKVSVIGVGASKEITDGDRTIQLIAVPNPHVSSMLIAYIPSEKLIFVSDLFSPGTPVQPGDPNATALLAAITNSHLAVDKIAGGHGVVGTFKDLQKVANTSK